MLYWDWTRRQIEAWHELSGAIDGVEKRDFVEAVLDHMQCRFEVFSREHVEMKGRIGSFDYEIKTRWIEDFCDFTSFFEVNDDAYAIFKEWLPLIKQVFRENGQKFEKHYQIAFDDAILEAFAYIMEEVCPGFSDEENSPFEDKTGGCEDDD